MAIGSVDRDLIAVLFRRVREGLWLSIATIRAKILFKWLLRKYNSLWVGPSL